MATIADHLTVLTGSPSDRGLLKQAFHGSIQLTQPGLGGSIRRHTPVSARGKRPARHNLRPIGECTALELLSEITTDKQTLPLHDLVQGIRNLVLFGVASWPIPARCIRPRVLRQECNL